MTDTPICKGARFQHLVIARLENAVKEHGEESVFSGHDKTRDNEPAKLRRELKKVNLTVLRTEVAHGVIVTLQRYAGSASE